MKCFKCDSEQDAAFFKETFPCHHCEEENLLEYNICPDCGWMWRSVNGQPFEESQLHIEDMGDFASLLMGEQPEFSEEEEAIMGNIAEHMKKVEKFAAGDASMADYVHKCLQCNSTAVDVVDGKYTCKDCDFEWEIVRFE